MTVAIGAASVGGLVRPLVLPLVAAVVALVAALPGPASARPGRPKKPATKPDASASPSATADAPAASAAPRLPPAPVDARGRPIRIIWAAPDAADLHMLIEDHGREPLPQRLYGETQRFVGAPYLLSPLGEGDGAEPDPDPRVRFDAFDCTTFVETAIALARSSSITGVPRALDRLRYRGAPAFATRRHLTESMWIPDLVASGELEDITAAVGGAHTVTSTFAMTPARWRKRTIAKALELPLDAVPDGDFVLRWIPIDALAGLDIPPGTVVSLVREDVPWSPTRISHQGLVLRDPRTGATFVRHASPVAKRVIDEPLDHLVRRYLHPKIERKWKPVGVNLLRVRD